MNTLRSSELRPGQTVTSPQFKKPVTVAGISVPSNGSAYCKLTFRELAFEMEFIPLADGDGQVWTVVQNADDPLLLNQEIQTGERALADKARLKAAACADYDQTWRDLMLLYDRQRTAQVTVPVSA